MKNKLFLLSVAGFIVVVTAFSAYEDHFDDNDIEENNYEERQGKICKYINDFYFILKDRRH